MSSATESWERCVASSSTGVRLLVTSQSVDSIARYDAATGAPVDIFDPTNEGRLSIPTGIAAGPRGKNEIYVANFHGQPSINRYDAGSGRFLGGVVRDAVGAIGIARGYEDDLYILSERYQNVLRLALPGSGEFCGNVTSAIGIGTAIAFLPATAPDADAAMFVSYSSLNQVLKFPMGKLSSLARPPYAGQTVAFRELSEPTGLAFGPDGLLYVANRGSSSILRYDADGTYRGTFVASGAGGLSSPYGIAFGPDGNLYVASHMSNKVLRFHGPQGSSAGSFLNDFIPAVQKPMFLMFYSI